MASKLFIYTREKIKAKKECHYCDYSYYCRKGHPCKVFKIMVKSKWRSKHRIKNKIKNEIQVQLKEYENV